MSLIFCIECGAKVSEYAKNCPNCGYPINKFRTNNQGITYEVTKKNNAVWIIAGYLAPLLAVFLHPIFTLVGIFIGAINIVKGSSLHGSLQIIESIFFGIIGAFINLFLFIL